MCTASNELAKRAMLRISFTLSIMSPMQSCSVDAARLLMSIQRIQITALHLGHDRCLEDMRRHQK